MKTFKDPIAIKNQKPKDLPKDGKPNWDFKCPQYDERSSCFISAGVDYGSGYNQPVGHSGNPKQTNQVVPNGFKKFNPNPS